MAEHNINITITATSRGASKAIADIQKQMSSLANAKVDGSGMSGLTSGAKRAKSSVEDTTSSVKRLSSALGSIKGAVAGAFAVGSIVSFGKAALEASANFEFLKKGLNFQIGEAETDKLISKMQKLGETSAYDSNQLIPMARKWINVGANADTAIQRMNMLVDAGSAFGLTAEQIGLCTDALTKMSSEGKINAEDMNALNDDGIPAWQLLSEAMGLPVAQLREMSSKGQLAGDAIDALYQGIESRTQGATANMNDTLSAAFANMEETAQNTMSGIGDILAATFDVKGILQGAGELAEAFKGHIENINEVIQGGGNPVQAILNEISDVSPAVGAVGNTVVAAFTGIKNVVEENSGLFKNLIIGIGAFAGTVITINKVAAGFTALKTTVMGIRGAITAATVAMRIFGAASLLNPVTLALAALVAVIAVVAANWDTISAATSTAWASITDGVSNTIAWIGNGFTSVAETLSSVWASITETAASVWAGITTAISAAWQSITSTVSAVWQGIVDIVSSVVTAIQDILVTGINIYVGIWAGIFSAIQEVLQPIVAWISKNIIEPIKSMFNETSDAISEMWNSVKESVSAAFDNVVETVSDAWTSIEEAASDTWNEIYDSIIQPVVQAIEDAWADVTETVTEVWDTIIDTVNNALQEIWSEYFEPGVLAMQNAWNDLQEGASEAWQVITAEVDAAWQTISSLWGQAAGWFESNIWQPLTNAVDDVKNAISDAFQHAYDKVTGIFKGLANWFQNNVWGPIKQKVSNIISDVREAESAGANITGVRTSTGAAGVITEATGGYIAGPGTGTSDSIPAWLSNGEFVMTAKATREYRPILESMNAGKYATGGLVGHSADSFLPHGNTDATLKSIAEMLVTTAESHIKTEAEKAKLEAIKTAGNAPAAGGASSSIGDAVYEQAAQHVGEQWGSNTCAAFSSAMIRAAGADTSLGSDLVMSLVQQAGAANHPASEGGTPARGDLVYWMRDGEADGNPYMHVGIADGQGGHIASNTHGVNHIDTLSGDYYGNGYYYGGYISMAEATGSKAPARSSMKNNPAVQAQETVVQQAEAAEKMQSLLNNLRMSLFKETATDYQKDMAEAMQKSVQQFSDIEKAKQSGASDELIKEMESAATQYQQILQKDIIDKHQKAVQKMDIDTRAANADMLHNYEAMADAKYDKSVQELDAERERKQQELMSSENDYVTLATITQWYYDRLKVLQDEHDKDVRESHKKQLQYMAEQGDLAGILADARNNPQAWNQDAENEGKKGLAEFALKNAKVAALDFKSFMTEQAADIGSSLRDQMTDSLTDFISGTKRAKDVFSDFGKSVLNMMAKIAAQYLASKLMQPILGSIHFSGGGNVAQHAVGGYITGPGTGTSDSIPAWLSNGEFVMTAKATQMYRPLLESMNAGKFADGGLVAPAVSSFHGLHSGGVSDTTRGGVVVNITNKTDSQVSVEGSRYNEDVGKWVLDIVVDGAARNVGGFSTNLKQALR